MVILPLLLSLAAQDEKPAPQIELRGLSMVEGISFKQGDKTKYSGDTYLLHLAFVDEKGAPFQPTSTMSFAVYNGDQPYRKAQRIVTKEHWKADASKIGQNSVSDNTIAFDKQAGILRVAFVRAEPGFRPKLDLTIEIKGAGTWVWKGVGEEAEYKAAAKGPDKPEKK